MRKAFFSDSESALRDCECRNAEKLRDLQEKARVDVTKCIDSHGQTSSKISHAYACDTLTDIFYALSKSADKAHEQCREQNIILDKKNKWG